MTTENLRPHFDAEGDLQCTPEITRGRLKEPPPLIGIKGREGGKGNLVGGKEKVGDGNGDGEGLLSRMLKGVSGGLGSLGLSEEDMARMADGMSADSIVKVIRMLNSTLEKKKDVDRKVEKELLVRFLKRALSVRQKDMERIVKEVDMLTGDIERVGGEGLVSGSGDEEEEEVVVGKKGGDVTPDLRVGGLPRKRPRTGTVSTDYGGGKIWNKSNWGSLASLTPTMGKRRNVGHESSSSVVASDDTSPGFMQKRQYSQEVFDEFQKSYFAAVGPKAGDARSKALQNFTNDMYKFTQYSQFRCRATLMHGYPPADTPGGDSFNALNIVSWIEFDRDSEFIATAGVTKRIKIYEFANISRDATSVHYPVKEIVAPAKLSCLSWNSYIRHYMVTSDYDGNVILWDAQQGIRLNEYEGHDKRAWSVDFSRLNPTLFASGSDDGRVKIWSVNQINSVMTIENKDKLNVCSVKFNPGHPDQIAFGSLDHCVHYFDLRNMREPLHVFSDHTRTVSYVNFLSPNELVSTCNDSTVKVWDIKTYNLLRTYTGHTNEKHFVGLSVTPDYIACGSEDNAVYAYYKSVSRPFASYKFGSPDPLNGQETEEVAGPQFISSVCWCPKNPRICLGANSQGLIKVLELEE